MENKKYEMTFTEAVARLHKRRTFKGRATRSEFWYAVLFIVLVNAARVLINVIFSTASIEPSAGAALALLVFGIVVFVYQVFLFFTGWGLEVRRFHDVGLSGWWTVIPPALDAVAIIAAIGDAKSLALLFGVLWGISLIARLVIVCLDSKKGRNKYGDSEKYPEDSPADQDAGTPPNTGTPTNTGTNFSLKS